MMISSDLRRQSRPLARMIRDFISIKRPLLSLVLGSVVFLAIMTITQNNTSQDSQEITRIESINKVEK
jgi:hypothetical protein